MKVSASVSYYQPIGPAKGQPKVRWAIQLSVGESPRNGQPEIALSVGTDHEGVVLLRWLGAGGAWSADVVVDIIAAMTARFMDQMVITSGVQLALPSVE